MGSMRYLYIVVFTFIIVLSGCSTKSPNNPENIKNTTLIQDNNSTNSSSEEDEFLDEFEQEMKVEPKWDPLSGYNRVMTSFNDGMYEYVLAPVASGYKKVVHKEIRSSIGKFFNNLLYPIRLVNNLLQGKLKNSGEETGRFIINTTIGIFGLFDPAKSYFGLEAHNEDFGQTLGYYGVKGGPPIVLPFLGPSNLRDMFSLYPDSLADPIDHHNGRAYNVTNNYGESLMLKAYQKVNDVSLHEGEYEKLKKDAIDLYPFLQNVYEQYREEQIKE